MKRLIVLSFLAFTVNVWAGCPNYNGYYICKEDGKPGNYTMIVDQRDRDFYVTYRYDRTEDRHRFFADGLPNDVYVTVQNEDGSSEQVLSELFGWCDNKSLSIDIKIPASPPREELFITTVWLRPDSRGHSYTRRYQRGEEVFDTGGYCYRRGRW